MFYCTPQTVANDSRSADASHVLLVVDEAHRALKQCAYCSVSSMWGSDMLTLEYWHYPPLLAVMSGSRTPSTI